MEEQHLLWVTVIVNWLLGKPALAVLTLLHIHPENPRAPIPNHIAMELVVFVFAIIFFLWLKARLSVGQPGATQQCVEMLLANPLRLGVRDMLEDFIGHDGVQHVAMLGSIAIFVLFCNLISLIPGFESPTAEKSVPLGCAVSVFLYYNWCGIKKHGASGYGRQFLGPVLGISWLMVIVELVSHLARLLSLTVRLWANMLASELIYNIFLGISLALLIFSKSLSPVGYVAGVVPLVVPPIFIGLHVFVAILQAFVFTILPIIYVGGAVAEHH